MPLAAGLSGKFGDPDDVTRLDRLQRIDDFLDHWHEIFQLIRCRTEHDDRELLAFPALLMREALIHRQ